MMHLLAFPRSLSRLASLSALCLATLCLAGCSDDADDPADGDAGSDGGTPAMASFVVTPGVETATVTSADPGEPLTLYGRDDKRLLTIIADEHGQAHFAYVPDKHLVIESGESGRIPIVDGGTLKAGDGYVIRDDEKDPPVASEPFAVLGINDVPDDSFYSSQKLTGVHLTIAGGVKSGEKEDDGFQYVTMRDGVTLGVMVRFPDPSLYGDGPYPTVIEYSGYAPSRPDAEEAGSTMANAFGYATVGVNMRGTGCSGGVFDVFNPAQHADGYDVVEIVARQDWALHHKVGMVGISYGGISQLFVASTRPPSLAAIAPLSVLGDPWEMQWPGGIYNSGFTRQWLEARDMMSAANGQDWSAMRIADGDETCEDNQGLRVQNIDFEQFLHGLGMRPRDADDRSLPLLVSRIERPVYLSGAFQDEQTGPSFGNMLDRFTASPLTRFVLYNGRHPDAYSPMNVVRWWEFLELYVAGRVPRMNPLVRVALPPELAKEFDAPGATIEEDRFPDFEDDDYDGVLAAYEAEPTVRVIFESGAGGMTPGAPGGRYETSFDAWPVNGAMQPRTFYLGKNGALTDDAPGASDGADEYAFDPDAGSDTFFGPKGYELMAALWDIDWKPFPEGKVLSYLTPPLAADTVVAGPGRATLWFSSEADAANVQVTLTEVRPDGNEFLVQSGVLNLGHRKIDEAASDAWRIAHTYSVNDFEPLPTNTFVEVKVAIPPVAHAFRKGSRLHMTVSTPGRNFGTWEFENPDYDGATPTFRVAHDAKMPSQLVLPIVSGIDVPADYPPCPSLRGQPCREFTPVANTPAD